MIAFTQNDTGPVLSGSVKADLTGATVELHLRQPYGGGLLTRTPTITDAVNGTFEYRWDTAELVILGVWYVEAQVTFSDGVIHTFGPQTFRVNPEIA